MPTLDLVEALQFASVIRHQFLPAGSARLTAPGFIGAPRSAQSASNRATCIGDGQLRPARVRTPRASNSRAMAARVVSPARWISAITVRVVALLVVCSDLAAGAFAFGGAFVLRSHMVKSQHVQ
jgi:hypothetical protein